MRVDFIRSEDEEDSSSGPNSACSRRIRRGTGHVRLSVGLESRVSQRASEGRLKRVRHFSQTQKAKPAKIQAGRACQIPGTMHSGVCYGPGSVMPQRTEMLTVAMDLPKASLVCSSSMFVSSSLVLFPLLVEPQHCARHPDAVKTGLLLQGNEGLWLDPLLLAALQKARWPPRRVPSQRRPGAELRCGAPPSTCSHNQV